jgi:phosphatidylglycerophosphate synthase
MIVWIDAAHLAEATPLFGLGPLQRLARTLRRLKRAPERIVVSGPAMPRDLPDGFEAVMETGATGARARKFVTTTSDASVLLLDATAVVDPRLVRYLSEEDPSPGSVRVATGGEGAERTGLVRLRAADLDFLPERSDSVVEMADAAAAAAPAAVVLPDDVPSFIVNLRRNLPFYLFAVRGKESAKRIERVLFGWNYKGSTDFMTKWVYPPIVWRLVKFATATGISANAITIVSVILTFAAVPLFATGAFAAGLACAYGMSVLDSVDGKVARVTLSDSAFGNILDHGLDIVHPPLWYGAWAWGLGARELSDPLMIAAILLIVFYIGDRLVLMVAKARFRRGLHAMHPIDAAARTWIARRNVNLVLLTIGFIIQQPEAAFYLIAAWQGATMLWHAGRTAWLIGTRAEPVGAIG